MYLLLTKPLRAATTKPTAGSPNRLKRSLIERDLSVHGEKPSAMTTNKTLGGSIIVFGFEGEHGGQKAAVTTRQWRA